MVAFYKHDIPAWMDGTENLTDGAYRLYHVVCQLIYLNEGPITLNEHGIAGRCRQSIRTFRANLKELIDARKLVLSEGRLANSRAEKELEKVGENRVNAGKGGKKSSENRSSQSKALKNNDARQAALEYGSSLKDKTRLDDSEPNGSGAGAPADLLGGFRPPEGPAPSDPDYWRKLAFSAGVQTVRRLTGKGDSAARTIVGKWLRDTRDDARRVIRAIEDAEAEQAIDPVAWISRALSQRQRGRPSQSVEDMLFARH